MAPTSTSASPKRPLKESSPKKPPSDLTFAVDELLEQMVSSDKDEPYTLLLSALTRTGLFLLLMSLLFFVFFVLSANQV